MLNNMSEVCNKIDRNFNDSNKKSYWQIRNIAQV